MRKSLLYQMQTIMQLFGTVVFLVIVHKQLEKQKVLLGQESLECFLVSCAKPSAKHSHKAPSSYPQESNIFSRNGHQTEQRHGTIDKTLNLPQPRVNTGNQRVSLNCNSSQSPMPRCCPVLQTSPVLQTVLSDQRIPGTSPWSQPEAFNVEIK